MGIFNFHAVDQPGHPTAPERDSPRPIPTAWPGAVAQGFPAGLSPTSAPAHLWWPRAVPGGDAAGDVRFSNPGRTGLDALDLKVGKVPPPRCHLRSGM